MRKIAYWIPLTLFIAIVRGTAAESNEVTHGLLGVHCNSSVDDENNHCVSCYFSSNCLVDNQCLEGTGGPTCERCVRKSDVLSGDTAYYRLGSACVECPGFTWSAVCLLAFIILFATAGVVHGLSASFTIKNVSSVCLLVTTILSG